jgi:hypothetical protein
MESCQNRKNEKSHSGFGLQLALRGAAILVVLLACAEAVVFAQGATSKDLKGEAFLTSKVTISAVKDDDVARFLERVSVGLPVTFNVEIFKKNESETFEIAGLSLEKGSYTGRELLEVISRKIPFMTWKASDGQINVSVGKELMPSSFSNIKLERDYSFEISIDELLFRLTTLHPEVRLSRLFFDQSLESKKFSFNFKKDMTMREIFNIVAKVTQTEWTIFVYQNPEKVEIRIEGEVTPQESVPGPSGLIIFRKKN